MTPPRVPRAVLAWIAPDDLRASLIDDLDEAYRAMLVATNLRCARRWYWRQALRGVGPAIRLRMGRRRRLAGGEQQRRGMGAAVSSFWQDGRYSLRMLRRSPGFAAIAVLVLALGIGVNTAVFSIVNAVFFRPLQVRAPNELVYLYQVNPQYNNEVLYTHYYDLEFFQQHGDAFAGVTGHRSDTMRFSSDGETDKISGEAVAPNYFDVLGVRPSLGRALRAEDGDVSSAERAMVISHDLWARRFNNDPNIVGKQVRLGSQFVRAPGDVFTIVGVAEPGFVGLSEPWTPSQYWVTVAQASSGDYRSKALGLIIRLKPGASIEQARGIVAARSPERQREWFEQVNPGTNPTGQVRVFPQFYPYWAVQASEVRTPSDPRAQLVPQRLASAVAIVVAIVLLIAAANIAGILMAAASRGRASWR